MEPDKAKKRTRGEPNIPFLELKAAFFTHQQYMESREAVTNSEKLIQIYILIIMNKDQQKSKCKNE